MTLALVGVLGTIGYQAVRTGLALRSAEAGSAQIKSRVAAGDLAGARDAATSFRDDARVARTHSDGLLWRAATILPLVGDDAAAVRDLSSAADVLGTAVPAALDVLSELQEGSFRTSGGVDLAAVEASGPDVVSFSRAVAAARAKVEDIDSSSLAAPVARGLLEADKGLETLDRGAEGVAAAVEVLPRVLGGDGRRSYLLVAQNNAEIRATGGLPGSASVLSADAGMLDLGRQDSAADFDGSSTPVAPLLPGERSVFGTLPTTDFRDTNLTPDFPRAASLMTDFARRSGRAVDGVVAVDPVLLARMLEITGPVRAGGRVLDADNALYELLSAPYLRLQSGAQQDAFFRLAARSIMRFLVEGRGDQAALLRVMADGVTQRRLLLWTRDEGVQDRIAPYAVAAALPLDTDRPEVGIYLNDGTGAKMQYYLRSRYTIASLGCDEERRQVMRVTARLTNDLRAPVSSLTDAVTGNGSRAPKGDSLLQVRIFAPVDGRLVGFEVDGVRSQVRQAEVYGRQVTQTTVQLSPGESVVLMADLVAGTESGSPRLQWTPGIEGGPSQAFTSNRCANW